MKRIGVDIDGVIADSQPVIIKKLNHHFEKNYTLDDFVDFDPVKMFGVGRSELDLFIMRRELEIIEEAVPLPGAVETLKEFSGSKKIILVSARTPAYLGQTLAWLDGYGIPHDELLLLGQHDKRQSCLDLCVDIFIEDNKKNAEQIASCGIPVLLMDAAYNRGRLPDTITRVHSWTEIRDCILKPL